MNVTFATAKLQRCYESMRAAERAWGREVAVRYADRIELMIGVEGFHRLFELAALRLHPLKGERAGEYAMTLSGRWRLIVEPSGDGRSATVSEVSHHYGD